MPTSVWRRAPTDRIASSDLSSFSSDSTALTAFEQAFIMPRGINAMTTTSTSYGITIKDVIGMLQPHELCGQGD